MSGAKDTEIFPYDGKLILDGYSFESGATIVVPYVEDIFAAIKDGSIELDGDKIKFGADGYEVAIKFNGGDDSTLVKLAAENGDNGQAPNSLRQVGFTGKLGGEIDTSEFGGDFLLKGNYAEKISDSQKRKPSTLISGDGDDTLLAGAKDFVDGGGGKNQIYLTPKEIRQASRNGATVAVSNGGRNTVYGFSGGFGGDDDRVKVDDLDGVQFKFQSDGLLLTANDSRLKFDGFGLDSASEKVFLTDGEKTLNAIIAKPKKIVEVTGDPDALPNAFFGENSGLDFTNWPSDLNINLADGTGDLGGWSATFSGITEIHASDLMCTLIGSDGDETLVAGKTFTTLGGGKGNDLLIGQAGDKNGRTTFLFNGGDGRDTIRNFEFLTAENYFAGTADKIEVGTSDINRAYLSGNNVVIEFDGDSYLTVEDARGKIIQIADIVGKVDENVIFDGLANCYVADGGSSLVVDSSVTSAEIWLDNSRATKFYGNLRTLDASNVSGNTNLAGNALDNTIIGGDGFNTFNYMLGGGNDLIRGTNDGDIINLGVTLDQISSTDISADAAQIKFTDGGSLRIDGTSDVTYLLADGTRLSRDWNAK